MKVKRSSGKRSPAKTSVKKAKAKAKGDAGSIPRPGIIAPVNGVLIGFVDDYFAKIGVIALKLKAPVSGRPTNTSPGSYHPFPEGIRSGSMQIDHVSVAQAKSNDSVGIKVIGRARRGDHVYLF